MPELLAQTKRSTWCHGHGAASEALGGLHIHMGGWQGRGACPGNPLSEAGLLPSQGAAVFNGLSLPGSGPLLSVQGLSLYAHPLLISVLTHLQLHVYFYLNASFILPMISVCNRAFGSSK